MSHLNPSQENSYPEDKVTHYPKSAKTKAIRRKMEKGIKTAKRSLKTYFNGK